jgi:hypothetical protein
MISVANAPTKPKISVNTGFSLSTTRAQTRETGRITSGLNRKDPKKNIDRENPNKLGTIDIVKSACGTIGSTGCKITKDIS